MTKIQRNLDGIYFRVKRDDEYESICYSDMTAEERDEIAEKLEENRTPEEQAAWWRNMANILAERLYDMGEQLGVMCE